RPCRVQDITPDWLQLCPSVRLWDFDTLSIRVKFCSLAAGPSGLPAIACEKYHQRHSFSVSSDPPGFQGDELRQAIVAMMNRKDELEEENGSLRNLLDGEMEHSAALRQEVDALKRRVAEQQERHSTKVQALARADRKWQCGCLHHCSRQEMAVRLLTSLQQTGNGNVAASVTAADRKWQCGCLHHRSRQEMAVWLLTSLQPTGNGSVAA
ncbi:hypothetical protein U0070_008617, partial [Myodes glareolus]